MPMLSVKTLSFFVEEAGCGEPILCLHGLTGDHTGPQRAFLPLTDRFRVICYDMRGHGASDKPAAYTFEDHVDDAIGLADALGLDSFSLIGNSMGSYVAAAAAARLGERCRRLVLVSPKAEGAISSVERLLRKRGLTMASVTPQQLDLILANAFWSPHTPMAIRRAAQEHPRTPLTPAQTAAAGDALRGFDLRPLLGKITAPTLVLTGADDRINPPEEGRRVAAGIPNGLFEEIPLAGHQCLLEQNTAICARLRTFLA